MPAAPPDTLASKPGPWAELALTLPVFLTYQLGVVFLNVRNATDLVTAQLMSFSHGDRALYLGLTLSIGVILCAVFALLGRGQVLHARKIVQIAVEGAAYAIAMSSATSWIVGKLFAAMPPRGGGETQGPFAGLVMSLGAGFYEELAFRVVLFGLGAKLWVALLARERVGLVNRAPRLSLKALAIMVGWGVAGAAAFSGMHYVGPLADPFELKSFVARGVLGLALTLVYATRGFAAAVWTHALYDVWVLVL
jgi:hypothetical protein